MHLALGIIIVIICLVLEGFFAGAETGIVSCDKIRMSNLADKNDRRAKIIISFLENPERFLSTTLVGVNIMTVTGSSVMAFMVSHFIDSSGKAALVSTLIILPLILVFGETVPKIIYQQRADTMALFAAYPLKFAAYILSPIVFLATRVSGLISKLLAKNSARRSLYVTREEIRLLILDAAKQGVIDISAIDITKDIFDFSKTSVRSVMVPLSHVISAQDVFTTRNVMELIAKTGFSRIPVYSSSEENVIGIIEMSDLAAEGAESKDLKSLMRPSYKVEEDRNLGDVLRDFQHNGKNVAIVVDKKGRAVGIATVEDIVEEIFGEIEDEFDVAETNWEGDFAWD